MEQQKLKRNIEEINESSGTPTDTHEDEPNVKIQKIAEPENIVTISEKLTNNDFTEFLMKQWQKEVEYNSDSNDVILCTKPFKLCVLQNFLSNKNAILEIVDEMTKVNWSRNQMDLYEFYQTTDLLNLNSPFLQQFYENLKCNVMPWLSKLTGIKLDRVSASCSMYNGGDYLLVHDDLVKDRQIAYVYYMSPWENAESWSDEMGGALELFDTDANGAPVFPTCKSLSPKNNQFIFFKVNDKSFHQVGEVTNFDYPRLTINGWFHGAENEASSNVLPSTSSADYIDVIEKELCLDNMINADYLNKDLIKDIQAYIEESSEISLEEYLLPEKYEKYLNELKNDESLEWNLKSPANARNYEILKLSSAQGSLKELLEVFGSSEWLELLNAYTDLDFTGTNIDVPKYNIEVQRWKHGCYTVLDDGVSKSEDSLDLVFYLNAADNIGVINYIDTEGEGENKRNENSTLLTVTPKDNTLNVVYRSEGTAKYTKYVSKRNVHKEYVYIIVCSYRVCNE